MKQWRASSSKVILHERNTLGSLYLHLSNKSSKTEYSMTFETFKMYFIARMSIFWDIDRKLAAIHLEGYFISHQVAGVAPYIQTTMCCLLSKSNEQLSNRISPTTPVVSFASFNLHLFPLVQLVPFFFYRLAEYQLASSRAIFRRDELLNTNLHLYFHKLITTNLTQVIERGCALNSFQATFRDNPQKSWWGQNFTSLGSNWFRHKY